MAHTKINEWKILGDGSLKAKIRGKDGEGAAHYIVHLDFFTSDNTYTVDLYDDWADLVGQYYSESLIAVFNFISKETHVSLQKLMDLMIEAEKIQHTRLSEKAEANK